MKILVPELMHPASLKRLRVEHDVHYDPTLFMRPRELHHLAQDTEVLIVRNCTQVRGDLLIALYKARVVACLDGGLDNIDSEGCRRLGIEVIAASDANARSVAEYVITCAMMLLRFSHYSVSEDTMLGRWNRPSVSEGFEIAGKTMGLIGFSSSGRLAGLLASRLDMHVMAYAPNEHLKADEYPCEFVALDDLLCTADVISIHCPLTPETRGLLNEERLAKMWPGAVLINATQGGIVDEPALATALKNKQISAAALDVFDEEPLSRESYLFGAPNLFLSPRIAGATADSELSTCERVVDRVLAFAHTTSAKRLHMELSKPNKSHLCARPPNAEKLLLGA
ncbi:3-phosphoglycerate dehydrogenase [Comamonas sp. Tr-654]|uniref:NAD(P)-dependent oxidoreductase n=1 Tax=Comamonas sp. Tr-654 TaxID=2608341 RepID=UPI00141EF5EC|nr:NAD(P)-dependent oxidoreductase [Comamonas sp. Tr-654]NIF82709.1 3-phosphoglycerate dehydrogenase [Comamonas sp. Tr-654]